MGKILDTVNSEIIAFIYYCDLRKFSDCDFYYCGAWSPPVQMDTYDSEIRDLIIAISHQSHFSQW